LVAKKQDELRVLKVKSMKKKILILIPSLVGGGAERTLVNILNHFKKEDCFDITLAVVAYVGTYKNEIPENIKVVPLFKNNTVVRILAFLQKKFGFNYFFKKKVEKNISESYDTAISFLDGNFTDLLFFLPNVRKRITWVHSSYESNMNFYKFYKKKTYRDLVIKNRYSKLDSIIFVSKDAKNEFINLFGTYKEMPIIYNLLDESSIREKANLTIIQPKNKPFHFIAVGSYYPVKGYDKLIDAAKILKVKQLDFKIDIYGKGFLKETLQNQIQELGLEKHVSLNDFVKNPYPLIASTDVFMMTSVSEAMPMALCEAMLLGKPTLVTNCSGCREVVGYGEFGLMVEQTPQAIAEGMEKYIFNKTYFEKYTAKTLERAIDFSDEAILKEIIKVF
jgi:glycosyltransferase involved in cell wall biosynthesis